jgi:hypothetical protein
LAGSVCLALIMIIIPTHSEAALPAKLHCCSAMVAPGHMTSQHCPIDPMQQQQCCAACALSLSLISPGNSSFIFSTFCQGRLPDGGMRPTPRSDRPPVPPPRFALS